MFKLFLFLFIVGFEPVCIFTSSMSSPVISDFDSNQRIIFSDVSNSETYFHYVNFDPNNSSVMYIGALDFVYRLYADNISSIYAKRSVNITETANYSTTYQSAVSNCRDIFSLTSRPDYQCRNHVRGVLPNINEIYVCSTGSYNPQDFYLSLDTLDVVALGYDPSGAGSGITKCPYDPDSQHTIIYISEGHGMPNSRSAIFSSLLSGNGYDYAIWRSAIQANRSSPIEFFALRDEQGPAYGGLTYVASYEIGQYVYFFYRELAQEFTNCGTIRYARVARVCKNDRGGLIGQQTSFMTFVKVRLNCSIGTDDIPIYFNELYDVQYDPVNAVFYSLFMASQNSSWGSAVCQFSYSTIDSIFDTGQFYAQSSQTDPNSQWTITPSSLVPNPRPSLCNATNNFGLPSITTQSFALSHPLMAGTVDQMTSTPLYSTQDIGYSHLAVDFFVGLGGNFTILYLYSDQQPDQIVRAVQWTTASGTVSSNVFSILKPFTESYPKLWDMKLHKTSKTWLYLITETAVLQVSVDLCSQYALCTDCVTDPYCGWDSNTLECLSYKSGLLQSVTSTSPLSVCQKTCKFPAGTSMNIAIPGTALLVSCSSYCSPEGGVTWLLHNSSYSVTLPVMSDPNFVLTRDDDLIILNVTRNLTGTFQCISSNVILAEYSVVLSSCDYSDNIRNVFLNEYTKWCDAFAIYETEYTDWFCLRQNCSTSFCKTASKSCQNV